jgi:hypothetical protein
MVGAAQFSRARDVRITRNQSARVNWSPFSETHLGRRFAARTVRFSPGNGTVARRRWRRSAGLPRAGANLPRENRTVSDRANVSRPSGGDISGVAAGRWFSYPGGPAERLVISLHYGYRWRALDPASRRPGNATSVSGGSEILCCELSLLTSLDVVADHLTLVQVADPRPFDCGDMHEHIL